MARDIASGLAGGFGWFVEPDDTVRIATGVRIRLDLSCYRESQLPVFEDVSGDGIALADARKGVKFADMLVKQLIESGAW